MAQLKSPAQFVTSVAAAPRAAAPGAHQPALKILWVTDLDYDYGLEHGGHLRRFNLARELVAAGHEVYFAVPCKRTDDPGVRENYLRDLQERRIITGFFALPYKHPARRGKLARLLLHPALSNRVLKQAQAPVVRALQEIITSHAIDLCILSDRNLLFVLDRIKRDVTTVLDWVDSYVLYRTRELRLLLRARRFAQAVKSARYLVDDFVVERYYGRQSAVNLVASPVDRQWLNRVNRAPARNRVLLNGLTGPVAETYEDKIPNRLIFTGNMNFPPNYESALWFIDRVWPLLRARQPALKLVVAGAKPGAELLARAGADIEVPGYVADVGREIARSELYVAPLVCGGGFKNKVIEAIANGTFVVATNLAVEFLDRPTQQQMLLADTPAEMAAAILAYFECPQKFAPRLRALQQLVRTEFSWSARARELAALAYEGRAQRQAAQGVCLKRNESAFSPLPSQPKQKRTTSLGYTIAHVMPWDGVGGTEHATLRIAQATASAQLRHVMFCLRDAPAVNDFFTAAGFETIEYERIEPSYRHAPSYLIASYRLAREFRRLKIDLVHCADVAAAFTGGLAGRLARVPVLSHVRSRHVALSRRDRSFLRAVNKFVFVSADAWQHFVYKVGARRGVMVYDGIDVCAEDTCTSAREVREELGIGNGIKVVGMVARVSPQKDYSTLAKAAARVVATHPLVRFLIVGDHEQEAVHRLHYEEVKHMLAINNVAPHFIFTGFRSEVARLVSAMDIFVLSTHLEGLPLVLLEAMAQAKPVVATAVGGIPEIVCHDQTGLLHAPQDDAQLAEEIISLLDNEQRAARLGAAGQLAIKTHWNKEQFANNILNVYCRMLGNEERVSRAPVIGNPVKQLESN
jgi:glycosyltransferase involved in cell wall biosynthesis